MTLRQAVETALKQNPDITLARLDEAKARQGVLVATLSNADVSSVTFTSDSSGQVVEISFASEKAEISQSPSGVRVSF